VSLFYRQLTVFVFVLFLQFALFASTVHAAEHPFHKPNEHCAAFINFSHHDMAVDIAPADVVPPSFIIATVFEEKRSVAFSFRAVYSSRAPPVS